MSIITDIKENPNLIVLVLPTLFIFLSSGKFTLNGFLHSFLIFVIILVFSAVISIITFEIYKFIFKNNNKNSEEEGEFNRIPVFISALIMATILIITQNIIDKKEQEEVRVCINDIGPDYENQNLDEINDLMSLIEYCNDYYYNTGSSYEDKPGRYE